MDFGYFTLSDNRYPGNSRTPEGFVQEIYEQAPYGGEGGLSCEMSRAVEIRAGTASAMLEWAERIQWDMRRFGGTQPRQYAARIRVAGAPSYTTLYAVSLEPETRGDTGYVVHRVDLLSLDPTLAGQPVEISLSLIHISEPTRPY